MSNRRPRWESALLALGFVLAACGSGEEPSLGSQPGASPSRTEGQAAEAPADSSARATAAVQPSLRILAPADGSVVSGPDVQVNVAVENFEVVRKQGRTPVPGEGHVHFYIDVDELPTSPGQHATPPGRQGYYSSSNTAYAWEDVSPGEHRFAVQLVTNNHRLLDPPVSAEVTVTVR
jgi:hypothetical protein